MEPPSPELVRTLRELKLCGPAELRQASKLVRDLAQDLPTFDCVWVDALAQLRFLTHFQAERITESNGNGLLVASHVMRDHLGRDSWYDHYRAAALETGKLQLLSCLDIGGLNSSAILERLSSTIRTLKRVDQRHLVASSRAVVDGDRLMVFSEPSEDRDLKELVTRRGRWRPELVRELAAQVATGLFALERAGTCHGDVRLETVTLSRSGVCRMKLPGVLAAVHPELTIHADFTPDYTECLAPERVGVGSMATPQADQYSLGCLMWHLLAGRPPYLSADPLTKVAQHQTRDVMDVRELAPETPTAMWHVIARLTSRDPENRYANWGDVLRDLGQSTFGGQRRLAAFASSFERAAVRARDWSAIWDAGKRYTRIGIAVGAIAFAAFWFPANRGLLLNIAESMSDEESDAPPVERGILADDEQAAVDGMQTPPYSLPQPNADGIVLLENAGPWRAGNLETDGTLIIRAAPGVVPVIVVENAPFRLAADTVRLENLIVQRSEQSAESGASAPLIELAARELHVERCVLMDSSPVAPYQPLVKWANAAESQVERLNCVDSFLLSQGTAFQVESTLQRVDIEQLLRFGEGPLVEFAGRSASSEMQLRVANATLRQAGPLLRMPAGPAHMRVHVENSVLEFVSGRVWLEFVGIGTPADWPAAIEITGDGTIATPGAIVGTRIDGDYPIAEVDESTLLIDGLFGGEFEFRGGVSLDPSDSMLSHCLPDVPRQSPADPGIDARRLIDPNAALIRTGELE